MKRILVPCDFSEPSKEAFKLAVAIASAAKGELYLLHVVEVPVLHNSLLVPVQSYQASFLNEIKQKYNKNVEKMREQWAGKIKVHAHVEHGSVESGIRKFSDKKKIDLIVMGTHGVKGLREYVVGSNTEKAVRNSKMPVIAVKKAPNLKATNDIVFPTDFSTINKSAIGWVKDFQKLLKAKLHVVFVNNPENFTPDLEAEKSLSEFVQDSQFTNYTLNIFNDTTEERGIVHFSQRYKNKIVVMPTSGRKGLNHFFNGSVTEEVLEKMNWPIFTFHK